MHSALNLLNYTNNGIFFIQYKNLKLMKNLFHCDFRLSKIIFVHSEFSHFRRVANINRVKEME